jgi:hypothetical protein
VLKIVFITQNKASDRGRERRSFSQPGFISLIVDFCFRLENKPCKCEVVTMNNLR